MERTHKQTQNAQAVYRWVSWIFSSEANRIWCKCRFSFYRPRKMAALTSEPRRTRRNTKPLIRRNEEGAGI